MPFSRSPQITLSETVELAGTVTVLATSRSCRSWVWPSAVSRRIAMHRTERSTEVASVPTSTVNRRPLPAGSEPTRRARAAADRDARSDRDGARTAGNRDVVAARRERLGHRDGVAGDHAVVVPGLGLGHRRDADAEELGLSAAPGRVGDGELVAPRGGRARLARLDRSERAGALVDRVDADRGVGHDLARPRAAQRQPACGPGPRRGRPAARPSRPASGAGDRRRRRWRRPWREA